MSGSIENQSSFLKEVAKKLGHNDISAPERPVWHHQPQFSVLNACSPEQLREHMTRVSGVTHAKTVETTCNDLDRVLEQMIDEYGGGSIVATQDERFETLELKNLLERHHVFQWDPNVGKHCIDRAAAANIGLSICDVMLAESATAGFFNDAYKARSVNLLPTVSLVIVPQSAIVPRLTQATSRMQALAEQGQLTSPYVNFISGPSNSADIEMRLVVGVHGPVKLAYVIVCDR
ncbi:MAG: lactate utilization protein C [Sporolactobacillus sp.]